MSLEDQKKRKPGWLTLEERLIDAIAEGNEKELLVLLQFLPESKKARYRQIWIDAKKERKLKKS